MMSDPGKKIKVLRFLPTVFLTLIVSFLLSSRPSEAAETVEVPLDFNNQLYDFYDNPVYATVTDISAPVTFHMIAENGSGNYKYSVNTIAYVSNNEMIADASRMPGYLTSPDYSFQFTASGEYYVVFYVMDMSTYTTTRKKLFLTVNDPARPTIEAVADSVAAQCNAAASGDFAKALWLNDWLVNHTVYDGSYLYCSAEGCLTRGTGTCEAYHRAYQMLLSRVGIASGRVDGYMHVWTAVQMDGNWYQVDVCWNDAGYTLPYIDLQHLYFGLTDSLIASDTGGTHQHSVGSYPSNAMEDNYFIKTGKIHTYSDVYLTEIRTKLKAKNTSFSLTIQNTSWADNFKNIIYSLVAYQLTKEDWSAEKAALSCNYSANTLNFTVTYHEEPSTETQAAEKATTEKATTEKATTEKTTTDKATERTSSTGKDASETEASNEKEEAGDQKETSAENSEKNIDKESEEDQKVSSKDNKKDNSDTAGTKAAEETVEETAETAVEENEAKESESGDSNSENSGKEENASGLFGKLFGKLKGDKSVTGEPGTFDAESFEITGGSKEAEEETSLETSYEKEEENSGEMVPQTDQADGKKQKFFRWTVLSSVPTAGLLFFTIFFLVRRKKK